VDFADVPGDYGRFGVDGIGIGSGKSRAREAAIAGSSPLLEFLEGARGVVLTSLVAISPA